MFGSRAFTSTQTGHRCTSSAKFTNTRQTDTDISGFIDIIFVFILSFIIIFFSVAF